MSNKAKGRAIANLPIEQYIEIMGGNIDNNYSGINHTNRNVDLYFSRLREFTLNRFNWTSNGLSDDELRQIEINLFYFGKCAILYPTITKNNIKIKSKNLKVFNFNTVEFNERTNETTKINVLNTSKIDLIYNQDEFVIIKDEYFNYNSNTNTPMALLCMEYANKLSELDLVYNAHCNKQRLPLIFNKGSMKKDNNNFNNITNFGVTISELIRSALGRNEQFTEVPEHMVGLNGFLHEPKNNAFILKEILECQSYLYEKFFQDLGLYTNKEKGGVYTVKDLQENGDETPEFKTSVFKNNRLYYAKKLVEKFNIDIGLEVI